MLRVRGSMRASAGLGHGSRGYGLVVGCQTQRRNDYVRDLVGLVKDLDRDGEGLEVGNGSIR
jgi:hypothetical protein